MKQIKSQDLVGDEKQRFGFRKTTLGLCGAILASSVMVLNAGNTNHIVHAATLDGDTKQETQDNSADKEAAQAKQDAQAGAGQAQSGTNGAATSGAGQNNGATAVQDKSGAGSATDGAGSSADKGAQSNQTNTDPKAQDSQAGKAQTGTDPKPQTAQDDKAQAGSQGQGTPSGAQAGQSGTDKQGSTNAEGQADGKNQPSEGEQVDAGGVIHENHNFGPNSQKVTFEFYDSQTGQAIQVKDPKTGKMVDASQELDGDTNDLVPIVWNLPENYKLQAGTLGDYRFTVNSGGADTNSVKGPDGQYQGTLQVGYGDPRWKHTVVDWGKNSIDGKMLVDPSKAQWGTDKDGNPLWANKNYGKDISVIRVNLDHQLKDDGTDTSTVTRNVTYPDPNTGADKTDKQTVTFTRPKQIDLVTGKPVYGDWDHATQVLPGVTLPAKPGYDSQNVPALTVKPGDKPADVVGKYVPHNNQVTISFKDVSAKDPQNVPDKTVTLPTDENADLTPDLPEGYVVAPGQDPHYKVGTDPAQSVTVKVVHGTKDLTNDPSQYNNTHKTINYTVTIVDPQPNAKPTVNKQTHTFTRSASLDLVTNKVNYGNWSDNGTFTFSSVKIPTVPGYTPSGTAPSVTVKPDSSDQALTVTYKANGQSITINYVDANGNAIGHPQTVPGQTGQDLKINYQIPDHWVQDPSDKLPETVHVKADNNDPITVKINHKLDKRDDDKLTVSRTIDITNPDGKTTTQTQTAVFTRAANYDEVLGKVIYGNWDKNSQVLPAVSVPDIPGYAKSSDAPALPVTPNSSSTTLKVTYKAIGNAVTINYVDDQGNNIGNTQAKGKTGETVNVVYDNVPAGWQVSDNNLPKTVTFTGQDMPDITAHISHIIDPESDQTVTVTRTINIINPDGSKQDPITQTVTFKRTKGHDEVTKGDVYGPWSENGKHTFDAVNIPAKAGYAPSTTIPSITVDPTTKLDPINVTYVAGGHTNSYSFVDNDNNDQQVGQGVQFAGKSGQSVDLNITVPAGYDVAANDSVPKSYTFPADDKDVKPIVIHLVHHVSDVSSDPSLDTTSTVSRTVEVTNPDGKKTSETESVTFTRPASKDDVTGKVTYGKWNKDTQELPAMPVNPIDGYTSSATIPALTVKPGDKPETVKVSYSANEQKTTWSFNDADDKDSKLNGQVHEITGKTGQSVDLDIQIPDGYVLDAGETIPGSYTFAGKDNKPIVITLHHGTTDVTGQDGSDTSRTIGRTINITKPDGKTTAITQTVTFTRTGTKDLVTGKIKYGEWSNGGKQSLAQLATPPLDGYKANPEMIPALDVTPDSQKMTTVDVSYIALNNQQTIDYIDKAGNTVGKQEVTGKTGETVKVVPDLPSGWVIDPDGQDKIPAEVTIKDVDTPIKVNVKHGVIVLKPGESNDKYGVKDSDVNRTVTRTITVITPMQGKNDNGQSTVNAAVPATGLAKTPVEGNGNTIVQSVKFMRGATIDEVTGQITYTDWKANGDSKFAEYTAPKISGYVAVPNIVPEEQATADYVDPKITITYIDAKEAGTQTIIYQDKDGNEVGKQDVVGKLNTDVKVLPDYPKGWTIDPSQKDKLPQTVHITDNNKPITVTVVHVLTPLDPDNPGHGLSADDFHRNVTRPIIVTMPDGTDKDMSQTIHFTRGGSFDEVTHDIIFTPWKGDQKGMPEVQFPAIDGKKATPNVIPAVDNVTIDTTFSPIHVEYQQENSNDGSGSWFGGAIDNGNGNSNNQNANKPADNTNNGVDKSGFKKTAKHSKKSLSDYERGYRDGFRDGYRARNNGSKYGAGYGYNGNGSAMYGSGYGAGYGSGFNGNNGYGYGAAGVSYEGAGNGYYGYGASEYVNGGYADNGMAALSGAASANSGVEYANGQLPQTGSAKTNAMAAAALAVAAGAGILGLAGTKKRRED